MQGVTLHLHHNFNSYTKVLGKLTHFQVDMCEGRVFSSKTKICTIKTVIIYKIYYCAIASDCGGSVELDTFQQSTFTGQKYFKAFRCKRKN